MNGAGTANDEEPVIVLCYDLYRFAATFEDGVESMIGLDPKVSQQIQEIGMWMCLGRTAGTSD